MKHSPGGRDRRSQLVFLLAGCVLLLPSVASGTDEGYRTPPAALAELVDAPASPLVMVTPGGSSLLVVERPSLPKIDELAAPELRLAGLRINPRIDGRSRTRSGSGLVIVGIDDGDQRRISGLPVSPRIERIRFSPDGRWLAFTHTTDSRIELWVANLESAAARRLSDRAVHLVAGITPSWLDDETLIAAVVPAGRGNAPQAPVVPSGPIIRQSLGAKAQARTYQDLLKRPYDEALFEHHLSSQLVRIGLDGTVSEITAPALHWRALPSPDGRYIIAESLVRPFSYLVPAWRFPRRIAILNRAGEVVRKIADLPLQEAVPIAFGSVATGPRSVSWRHDAPATAVWVEAQDGGDAGRESAIRDRLYVLESPFEGEATAWADLRQRFSGIAWGHDDLAIVTSRWWKTRSERRERLRPGDLGVPPELLVERSMEDRYSDPGRAVTTPASEGRQVLLQPPGASEVIYRIGAGASPEGDRPFLDEVDLATGKTKRRFRSSAPYYELPVLPLADGSLLSRRESVTEPPNYGVRMLAADSTSDPTAVRTITDFPHPTPQLTDLKKQLITYQRDDGVALSATLYLPPGHDPAQDGALPMVMWAYPIEFKSAAAAGQIRDSPYRFERISWRSPVLWLARGYAVLDDPKMPIVGEGDEEPNDRFREQLVSSARAAVEAMVERGITERHRIAIGGHSYGAFMTANLLAHSDLFAAGIARSGAYNRTLTPFGFQAEERTFWQAPEVYFKMSPFMHAEKIDEPILLIHGDADNNSGTFPIQSERFYHALKGHGATTRLVMLPHESHGYRARESILHMLFETDAWLERYVKNGETRRRPSVEISPGQRGSDR